MKYILSFLFLVSINFAAFAQIEIDRLDNYLLNQNLTSNGTKDLRPKSFINLGGSYHVNSSAMTNTFLKKILYGGFVNDMDKDDVSKRLKANNRMGLDLNVGVTSSFNYKGSTIIVGINHREFFNLGFTKDAFEIGLRGNKSYANKTADLAPLKLKYFNYENLFVGIQKSISDNLLLGGGISIIRAGAFQMFDGSRATLFTEKNGEYLDVDMKFKMAYSQKDNALIPASSGAGAALNFNLSHRHEKGQLNFEVRDLGFISWRNVQYLQADTSFRFEGKSIIVFALNDSAFTNLKTDSIASVFHIQKKSKNVNFFIPATIHLNYLHNFSDKLTVAVGIKQMLNASYIPRVYIKPIYYLKNNFILAPTIAYGGFGGADLELGLGKKFADQLLISANIFYLEYLLLPKRTAGHGCSLSISKIF